MSQRSRAGPYAAGSYRERQHLAAAPIRRPGPLASDSTVFPSDSPARNFPPLPFLPLFPAASFSAEEPASYPAAAINRGAVGGGEKPKNNGRPLGDLGEAEGGGAAALPRR
jgi:hypothetical protein